MYLEKLKIFGFKSFAKKAVFDFMPGITGVVGPNGCGKSNVVDAIRWVLGEQKAGTLRSDRMENVIFNGSKNQKPMGMAEVAIVIQNTKYVLPVEYSEVMITRRLFRSGESQYLLNNNPCRLKDINDLLMDTGLTPDAYSVIELSMVESILNGKPEDRRRIFEEAVGITKYKQRRKLTLRKLDATEQDLIRLDDIINEVRSKVNSLHRQVRRARRYQDLAKDLKETELRVATHKYSSIYEELVPLNEKYEEMNRKRESLTSQISFKEAEVEAFQTDLLDLEQQLRGAQTQLNQINNTIHKCEEEILLNRERLKSLVENKTRIGQEIENLKRRIASLKDQGLEIQDQLMKIAEEIEQTQQAYNQERQSLEDIEKNITEKKAHGREVEQKVLDQMQSISEKQRILERLTTQLTHLKTRQLGLSEEKQNLLKQIDEDSQLKKQLQETEQGRQRELDRLIEAQTQLELKSEQLQSQGEQLKDSILKKNNQIESIQQRMAFFKELLESYADYPQGVKYLMVSVGSAQGFETTLADVITVDDKYRKAIESALGERAAYLLVSDAQTAYLGINTLNENQQGIVTFLPIQNLSYMQPNRGLPSEPGIIGWADDLVNCSEQYLPIVKMLLGSYLVVKNLTIAKELASELSGQGIHIVTPSGEIIFSWGGIKGGQKYSESESIIGRQDQLQNLNRQIDELHQELSSLEKKLKDLQVQRMENGHQKDETAQKVRQIQEQLSQFRMQSSQVDYRIYQANNRLDLIDKEQVQLTEEFEKNSEQHQKLEQALRTIAEVHSVMNEQFKGHQKDIDEIEKSWGIQANKVNQLNLRIVELTGNERNLKREYEQVENQIREHENTIKNREQELIKSDEQRVQMEARIDELSELLASDYSTKEESENKVSNLEQKNRSFRENVEQKVKTVTQLRKERESISDAIHQIELKKSELRINADNMYSRILEEYDAELKRESIDKNYNISVDEEQIEILRQKIKNLGPVNLLALKEYEQEKGRLDFLEKQQQDLISAEQNLKETILHINQTAQQKFDTVFQEIRQNFIKVFKQFFSEGDADLIIAQDEDPLDATIEIKANPKGKRMESLTLLSGGEKALTAISLLFGIYLVKPSPICILDEVDAPLDDNNVKRFIKTLKQFANSTQFIIVTHNKLTMKSADCLYGITMEESGISKLVSVKLD
ncbi:MAG: chromosome segregation protein SMC [bacterium]|nr:MAG: chromosome segregation protein SMC [bacterium]